MNLDGVPDQDGAAQAREHNRRAWNKMVHQNQRFTRPARDEDFADPLRQIDDFLPKLPVSGLIRAIPPPGCVYSSGAEVFFDVGCV